MLSAKSNNLKFLIILFFISITIKAQEDEYLKIEKFIYNTELLRINDKGIIIPQMNKFLNEQIKNYMFENFFSVVESVDNIIWQSYQTRTNTIVRSQFINYFVRVQIKNSKQIGSLTCSPLNNLNQSSFLFCSTNPYPIKPE